MAGIAVISAFNPYNYGMYSVDLAAHHFFTELGEPFTHVVTQRRTRTGRLRVKLLREVPQFGEFDSVVYWGDFLNNPMWGAADYVEREAKRHQVRDPQQAWGNWRDLYLNLKRHHPKLRVFAIGGCFLGADGLGLARARKPFQEFVHSADLVSPRDDRSFEIVRQLVTHGRVLPGIDCAWLLPFEPRPEPHTSSYFVSFLGRTLRHKDCRFIREVARRTGLRPVWIDWMNLRPPRFLAHWNFERMHRLIAGARFVLTDAYHLVINSLNRSVRTVCLHDADQSESNGTCGDVKKRILLEQVGLPSMLVDVGDRTTLARRIVERMEACESTAEAEAFAKIARRREQFRATLLAAFKPICPAERISRN